MPDEDKIRYVVEVYSDEYRTLNQAIKYRYGHDEEDYRERDFWRSKINPNLTKLIRTEFLDANREILYYINQKGEIIYG